MIVVDTNLIAYFYFPSPQSTDAVRIRRADPDWAAPYLWRSEFRNVLSIYLRKGVVRFEEMLDIQREAESIMRGNEHPVDSREVLHLVNRSKCSAYDCEFVALARELSTALVTSDRKVIAAFPEIAVSPGDWQPIR